MVFAAIQIHESRAALVRPNPSTTLVSHPQTLWFACLVFSRFIAARRWSWFVVGKGQALPHCIAMYHCCFMAVITILDKRALLRIRVSPLPFERAFVTEIGISWAIFHVVGANPAMKSTYLRCRSLQEIKLEANQKRIAMYQFYQIMICLLKFDFFCFIGVTSQVCSSHPGLLMVKLKLIAPSAAFDRRIASKLGRVWIDNSCHPCCTFLAHRLRHSSAA